MEEKGATNDGADQAQNPPNLMHGEAELISKFMNDNELN
jgi:hypothetical protein